MTTPTVYANTMTDQQRALYYAQMSAVQRDEVVGVLLAVFLGIFGAHLVGAALEFHEPFENLV